MRLIVMYLVLIIILFACKKEQKIDNNSIWQCNQSQNLDSTLVSSKLIGTWKCEKRSCFWTNTTELAKKNVIVTFKSDRSFFVTENAVIITQGNWKVVSEDSTSWGLNLSSPSEYLYGRILFCDNLVLFNNSYVDGCDNLFKK